MSEDDPSGCHVRGRPFRVAGDDDNSCSHCCSWRWPVDAAQPVDVVATTSSMGDAGAGRGRPGREGDRAGAARPRRPLPARAPEHDARPQARRPAGRGGRRPRDRVAAGGAAQRGQREDPRRPARLLRGGGVRGPASRRAGGRSIARRRPPDGQPALLHGPAAPGRRGEGAGLAARPAAAGLGAGVQRQRRGVREGSRRPGRAVEGARRRRGGRPAVPQGRQLPGRPARRARSSGTSSRCRACRRPPATCATSWHG